MQEFDLIKTYFLPLCAPEGLGLKDDAALLTPPAGQQLVVTADMLLAGVHFRPGDSPYHIALKAIGVNVSDLAAKGAQPWRYFLSLGLTGNEDEHWLAEFARGLGVAQDAWGIQLAGGDTTSGSSGLSIAVTAVGLVAEGAMIRRSGALPGHDVWVTGRIGRGFWGLESLEGRVAANAEWEGHYLAPKPQLLMGRALVNLASACADISDGLIADLGHIANASACSAVLDAASIPIVGPDDLKREDALLAAVTGGDDYELVFTAPASAEVEILARAKDCGVTATKIGTVQEGCGVKLLDEDGQTITMLRQGYEHITAPGRGDV